ncbi:MAG: hypothetical protein L3J33_05160 [Rhodobacteraceae bacterium]|nr:hypothetical protein [Paracoccaceae bacterium]
MAMISGENQIQTSDDFYSVRSGASQVLDVLANDEIKGPIVVLDQPRCGTVALSGASQLLFSSSNACSGEVSFAYCVDASGACEANSVTLNVISVATDSTNPQPVAIADSPVPDAGAQGSLSEIAEALSIEEEDIAEPLPRETAAVAPVVVETVAPTALIEDAPGVNNIIVSMQAPTLVAPNIDEFVTPSAATASIRQQTAVLDNATTNTDSSIATQSSAETVAPVEFGIANFGAPLESENSNVIIGGADQPEAQIAAAITPQLTTIAPEANPVNAPLGRGPMVLAELPDATVTPFEEFVALDQSGTQFVAAGDAGSFTSPENNASVAIAAIEPEQTTLRIEQNGTTALIALQLSGPPLPSNQIETDGPQLLALQQEQSFSAQQPAPVTLANSGLGDSSPVVLEREPLAFTDGFVLPDASVWASTSTFESDILELQPLGPVVTAMLGPLDSLTQSGQGITAPTALQSQPFQVLTYQNFSAGLPETLENDMLVMASLGTGIDTTQQGNTFEAFTPESGYSLALPLIDKTTAPAPLLETAPEPADQTQLASLEPQTETNPVAIVPVPQLSTCEIFLDPSVRTGANILLFLIAECKPEMPVTISHAGMEFTILTDAAGTANVVVPALQRTAEITATFEDGSSQSTVALVTQISDVTRAVVTWRGNADLDLHAFEFGARPGTEGHVWPGSARDYRSARLRGGGYLVELGDKSIEGGALAEVYTMPLGRLVTRGTVTMTLEVNNGSEVCGSDISARTIRTRPDNSAGLKRIRFTVPGCGGGALAQFRVAGAVDDIRLAAQ